MTTKTQVPEWAVSLEKDIRTAYDAANLETTVEHPVGVATLITAEAPDVRELVEAAEGVLKAQAVVEYAIPSLAANSTAIKNQMRRLESALKPWREK